MIRIGRDHGKFRHEVGALPWQELMTYEANYRYEHEQEKERQRKSEQAARQK